MGASRGTCTSRSAGARHEVLSGSSRRVTTKRISPLFVEDLASIQFRHDCHRMCLTPVASAFGGQLRSRIVCPACGHASDTFEPFSDLSLEIQEVRARRLERAVSSASSRARRRERRRERVFASTSLRERRHESIPIPQ